MTDMDLPTRVQAAADRLLHAVSPAAPGTWRSVPVTYGLETAPFWEIHAQHQQCATEVVVSHQVHEGGGIDARPNAEYIVLTQPAVGRLLAEWLHVLAGRMRDFQAAGVDPAAMADDRLMALVNKLNALKI